MNNDDNQERSWYMRKTVCETRYNDIDTYNTSSKKEEGMSKSSSRSNSTCMNSYAMQKQNEHTVEKNEKEMRENENLYQSVKLGRQQAFKHFYLPQFRRQQAIEDPKFHNVGMNMSRNGMSNKYENGKNGGNVEKDMRQYMRRISAEKVRQPENLSYAYRAEQKHYTSVSNVSMECSISKKEEDLAVAGFLKLIDDLDTIFINKFKN